MYVAPQRFCKQLNFAE